MADPGNYFLTEEGQGVEIESKTLKAFVQLAFLTLACGLVFLIVRGYGLENSAFVTSLLIAIIGFPINHALPHRLRLPFFVGISMVAIIATLGSTNAVWLVGIGSIFILLAHLPIAYKHRVACQLALLGMLIVWRSELLPSSIPQAIWPILGSMFIFRMIIYMYDLRKQSTAFNVWRSYSYFFMMPNVNFTLLPVIDYKNLFAVYYPKNTPELEIYHKGLALLFRGVIHLLLYRLVYQNVLLDPVTVTTASEAAQYLIGIFLLYLRISGYFHMISGILHLYGFNLPETHHLYFLASSFTDFWRRINIFWKDFMQKIFFYPIQFFLGKKFGPKSSLVLATAVTFVITWFLHAYQWYWIRGEFKVSVQDILFWGSLGVVVILNILVEIRFPRRRSLKAPKRTWKSELLLALKTILTFCSIVLIWNVWSTPNFTELGNVLAAFGTASLLDLAKIALFFVGLGALAIIYGHRKRGDSGLIHSNSGTNNPAGSSQKFWSSVGLTSLLASLLLYINYVPLNIHSAPLASSILNRMTSASLNATDQRLLQRGYYEELTDVGRFSAELQQLYGVRPRDWGINPLKIEDLNKFPGVSLSLSSNADFKNALVTTNALGIRDIEYAVEKPQNTFRAGIVGASHTFGSGVNNNEVYEQIVEGEINELIASSNTGIESFELLNFSMGGLGAVYKTGLIENNTERLDLDAIIYVLIDDYRRVHIEAAAHLTGPGNNQLLPEVTQVGEQLSISKETNIDVAEIKLRRHLRDLVRMHYEHINEFAAKNDVKLWFLALPLAKDQSRRTPMINEQIEMAKSLGIEVLDIRDAYDSLDDKKSVWIAPWDEHPNAEGHGLLAGRFSDVITPIILESINQK
ncbi:MAG: D-alanyl-lipoteichoic acid acyltransferase DltB (MBOAT superfamily) [Candidatus Azotimanducaceae bacterium]|jgi:D-alanyl-lipoteichoic acid acyltransferase DltB (MBOAT superfamily)